MNLELAEQNVQTKSAGLAIPVCPLCGSSNGKSMFTQRGHTLIACDVCELFFIYPYPRDIDHHHEAVSDYAYEELEVLGIQRQYQNEILFYTRFFDLVDKECSDASVILDVGCGCGHLLERLASHRNLHRAGIELNRERAAMARKVARCEIFEVPIEDFRSPTHFDVVILMNVFSHVPAIDRLFEKLRSILTERGRVILKTSEMKDDVRESAVSDWAFPDHIHFLGMKTLEYICRRHGFQIQTHLRNPLSKERFAPYTWKMKGRSAFRNVIKGSVVRVPFALPALARYYDLVHKQSMYSSFMVLRASHQT
jgi:SAM-dependent methyltransferase